MPESDPGGTGADSEEVSSGERAAGEANGRDAVGSKGTTDKDAVRETEPKEDVGEAGSDTAVTGIPVKGGVPLFLGEALFSLSAFSRPSKPSGRGPVLWRFAKESFFSLQVPTL